jgi:hypothetical protein
MNIEIKLYRNPTWQGEFTILIMHRESGYGEEHFATLADAEQWIADRKGSLDQDWRRNRFNNAFKWGSVPSLVPALDSLEVEATCTAPFTPSDWQRDPMQLTTNRIQYWHLGNMCSLMTLEGARHSVQHGYAFVINDQAIGALIDGQKRS